MNEIIEISYGQWFDKYQPRLENNQMRYYETFGEDLEFIKTLDPLKVWTMLDSKYIINGKHFVNRLVYIVTRFSWEKGQEIQVEYE